MERANVSHESIRTFLSNTSIDFTWDSATMACVVHLRKIYGHNNTRIDEIEDKRRVDVVTGDTTDLIDLN
jgi:hypothetical protein